MNFFAIAGQTFAWEDLCAAAEAWQEWEPHRNETHEILACLQHARHTPHPITTAEINAAVTAFRYAH